MIEITTIDTFDKELIKQIVRVHLETFKGFFLSFMGRDFLYYMYSSYCEHNESGLIVALEGNLPIGFLAYSCDFSDLYKYMLKKKLLPMALCSVVAVCKQPKSFLHIMRAFLKPKESRRKEQYIELSSIGVATNHKHHGIGTQLIEYLKRNTDFSKYEYIKLETDAIDNEYANRFYKRNGFVIFGEYTTNEGRKMIEYRFRGAKDC